MEMDEIMSAEGYEKAELEGADTFLYVPKKTYMIHVNHTSFTKEPFKSSWTNGTTHHGMRRVFFRTNEVRNGYVVFHCDKADDR